MKKSVTILGSTGSVGRQIVEVLSSGYMDHYSVDTLTAHSNFELLAAQARQLHVKNVIIADQNRYSELKRLLSGTRINIYAGKEEILQHISGCDIVFIAMSGIDALKPLYIALKNNIAVALANKESIICGGELLSPYIKNIYPLDSEHFSIYQLLKNQDIDEIRSITLTASGGPFFQKNKDDVAIADALQHPIWPMGAKISIDSATMMNKVLEVIEAHYLFNLDKKKINISVHPEAIVHGLVSLKNYTCKALLYRPDMKIGINSALSEFANARLPYIEEEFLLNEQVMSFFSPDRREFPALDFLETDQYIILDAANMFAVSEFLNGKIKFQEITKLIAKALHQYSYRPSQIRSIEDVMEIHDHVRSVVMQELRAVQYC